MRPSPDDNGLRRASGRLSGASGCRRGRVYVPPRRQAAPVDLRSLPADGPERGAVGCDEPPTPVTFLNRVKACHITSPKRSELLHPRHVH